MGLGWGLFFLSIAQSLAKRVLIGLGMGFITYAGFGIARVAIEGEIDQALGQVWGDVYSVLALAGFIDSIGIFLGTFVAMATLAVVTRLGTVHL
jgi:hypothetical protein